MSTFKLLITYLWILASPWSWVIWQEFQSASTGLMWTMTKNQFTIFTITLNLNKFKFKQCVARAGLEKLWNVLSIRSSILWLPNCLFCWISKKQHLMYSKNPMFFPGFVEGINSGANVGKIQERQNMQNKGQGVNKIWWFIVTYYF